MFKISEYKGLKEYKCHNLDDFMAFYRKTELWRPSNVIRSKELLEKEMLMGETCSKIWSTLVKKENHMFKRDGFLIIEYNREAPKVKFRRKKEEHRRPNKPTETLKSKNVSLRLTEQQFEKVKAHADKHNMTVAQFLIKYVDGLMEV